MICEKIVDTHCHLNDETLFGNLSDVLKRAFEKGVERIIVPGVNVETSRRAIEIAEMDYRIWAAVGIHPNEVNEAEEGWEETIRKLACHPKVVAIGETGMDLYRNRDQKERQIKFFEKHIDIAEELGLPLIIHIRNAHRETKEVLEGKGYFRGVFHMFSGDRDFLKWAIEKGFYISFGGPITFKNFRKEDLIRRTPIDRLLLETDSPYLSPHPFRGKRNEPGNIVLISEKLSSILEKELAEINRRLNGNVKRFFRIEAPCIRRGGKKLGQNFLINDGIGRKIVEEAGRGKIAIEIGPGKGALTKFLLQRFERVILVEVDDELCRELSEKFKELDGKKGVDYIIVNRDFLHFSIDRTSEYFGRKIVVIGNIPYYLTSSVLFKLYRESSYISKSILTIQREVADRITSKPFSKNYGILSVLLQRKYSVRKKFNVSPGSFCPSPSVCSAVITLTPLSKPLCPEIDDDLFTELVKSSFAHRRKKLLSNLESTFPGIEWRDVFKKLYLSENTRPEEVTVELYCEMAGELQKLYYH